jgi:hypothetical protein
MRSFWTGANYHLLGTMRGIEERDRENSRRHPMSENLYPLNPARQKWRVFIGERHTSQNKTYSFFN